MSQVRHKLEIIKYIRNYQIRFSEIKSYADHIQTTESCWGKNNCEYHKKILCTTSGCGWTGSWVDVDLLQKKKNAKTLL